MKRYLAFVVVLIVGVILGPYVSHPPVVRAQQAGTTVHTTFIPTRKHTSQFVLGEVIGFSFTTNDGISECYVLSR
jgi:hypothetical protein